MIAAQVTDGCVSYRTANGRVSALSDFALSVGSGEVVALLGASGSGKSSLLKVFAGSEALEGGSVTVLGGTPLAGIRSGRVALASQDAALLPWRSAIDNVRLPLDLLGRPRESSIAIAAELLDRMKIDGEHARRPSQLSEGQLQRLRLAQALATSPELLLLDEPFSNADEGLRISLMNIVSLYIREEPTRACLLVTHYLFEAAAMADRIVIVGGPPLKILYDMVPDVEPGLRKDADIEKIAAKARVPLINSSSERRAQRR